ncbi:MAG TPA: tripartite tricarboxylate transporter substrate-binding protein [Burkholderiales bacterium]
MFARLLCIVLASVAATVASAQSAGRVVVPYPPGGSIDTMARVIAAKLAEATARSFVVENRGGAAGAIGSASVKGGPTDGSLLLIAPDSNISVYPATVTKAAYAPLEDFVAIAHTGDYRISLSVHPSVPAQDLKSFVAWTKSQPDAVGYGTAGAGTNLHFYGVLFAHVSGANMKHVPYRGSGPAVTDLIAGHIPAIMLPFGSQLAHLKAGRLRMLAQTGENRAASAPDVPSFKELGYPTLAFPGWYGIFAPAGTPAELVNRYNDVIVKAIRAPEVRERMRAVELEPREMSAAEFQVFVKADTERWAPIIKASGFTPGAE